jgi:hypothetical protein
MICLYIEIHKEKDSLGMGNLEAKKVKLQTRVRQIVSIYNQNHFALMNLEAQTNSEHLIALIENCKKHNQIEVCKSYVDQFEKNPYFELPDLI